MLGDLALRFKEVMDQIKDIVSKVIGDISSGKPQTQFKIHRIWQGLCDPKTSAHTAIAGLQQGQLTIHVDSPARLFHMNLHKRKLFEKIKNEIPEISSINFRIGKIK